MVVLSPIFMKGCCIRENPLFNFLSQLELDVHETSGLVRSMRKLTTRVFVKRRYLEHRQVPFTESAEYELLWGPRAFLETNQVHVLRFSAALDANQAQTWTSQDLESLTALEYKDTYETSQYLESLSALEYKDTNTRSPVTVMMTPLTPPAVPILINRCYQDELMNLSLWGTRPKATDNGGRGEHCAFWCFWY